MSHKSSTSADDKLNSTSDNMVERLKRKISAKSIVGTILLLMIASVFVFFGLPTQKYGGMLGTAAEINGQYISVADFQQEENRIMEQYSQYFKGQDMGPMRKMLKSQALSNLVTTELISQGAQIEKLLVTPMEIRDVIVNEIPAFQEGGRFRRDRYQQYLDGTRTTAVEFEKKIEKSLVNMRLRRIFEAALIPSELEVKKEHEGSAYTFKLAFIKLDKEVPKVDAKDDQKKKEELEKKAIEAYQSKTQTVKDLLAKKDMDALESYLKKQGQKWKEVEGNLSQMFFGELPLKAADEVLTQVKKPGEIYPQLISEGADQYIVKFVSYKHNTEVKTDIAKEKDALNKKYAMTVFENWINDFKKKSKVHENRQLLDM